MNNSYDYRPMTIDDYDDVFSLWKTITGFGIRSIDDSREGIGAFIRRNPGISVVAVERDTGNVVGSILCGHDGRTGSLYHVCVHREHRKRGIGSSMVAFCERALRAENVNKISLLAFTDNDGGNAFWRKLGWVPREDANFYDYVLNSHNITAFNK